MMTLVAAMLRVVWSVAYVILITLAALALPVTCRCGDQAPGPRALIVAADRIKTLDPKTDYGTFLPTSSVHERNEQPQLGEMPTTLEFGLAAIALIMIIGTGLMLPRPAAPVGVVRFLLGRQTPPWIPPPRSFQFAA